MINMEARVPSTFSLKVASSKVLGPRLNASFISAGNETGVGNAFKWHSEDLNCEKRGIKCYFLQKEMSLFK